MLLQALKAEADASQSKLDRGAEAQRSLQAEVERLRKAHKSESSAALAVLEEKDAWIAKTKAKEEVGGLGIPTCLYHARTQSNGPVSGQAYKVIHGDMKQGASVKVALRNASERLHAPRSRTASEKDCQDDQSNSTHALQELKDAMQQHKALQQAAAAAETHAAVAAQRQAEHAEENAALRQEIQVGPCALSA